MLGHSWKGSLGLHFFNRRFAAKAKKLSQIEGSVAAVTLIAAGVESIVGRGGLRGSTFDGGQLLPKGYLRWQEVLFL